MTLRKFFLNNFTSKDANKSALRQVQASLEMWLLYSRYILKRPQISASHIIASRALCSGFETSFLFLICLGDSTPPQPSSPKSKVSSSTQCWCARASLSLLVRQQWKSEHWLSLPSPPDIFLLISHIH